MNLRFLFTFVVLMVVSISAQNNPNPSPFGGYTVNLGNIKLELIRIPTGSFVMGNDKSPYPEEKPAHQVNIKSVYLGRYEVTRQQWNWVVDNLPKINKTLVRKYIGPILGTFSVYENNPTDEILWDEAVEFCDRISRYTGKKYRLPSEAEWEYGCRAGTTTEYSWGDILEPKLANLNRVAIFHLPVGQVGYSNPWGFFDMHGNVAEMCADYEHSNYQGAPTDGSVWNSGGDKFSRVIRGGDYYTIIGTGRSFYRSYFLPVQLRATGFGFRVVAEITPTIGTGSVTATSAANYLPQNLAADSLGSLFGTTLSTESKAAESLPLPTTLSGSSVFIKDILGNEHLAKMLYASPTQINFQLPPNLPAGAATIYAVSNGNIHSSGTINITKINPGFFSADATGTGLAAAVVQRVKSTGEQVYEQVVKYDAALNRYVAIPIDVSDPNEQVFLAIFGTGIRSRSSLANVSAMVGNSNVEVLYAGDQGFYAGVDQVNIRLPRSLSGSGEIPIAINVDGIAANPIKINIK